MPDAPEIIVCGCGQWGRNLVRNMAELGALAGIVDDHPETARTVAAQYGVPATGLDVALANPAVKGIMIATPAITHAALAKRVLEAGKHVFVEKPLALAMEDAEALRLLAQKQRKTLMVGHLLHYHPAYQALKSAIAAGRIGTARYIESNRLNFGRLRHDENVLWSFAPHDFSMILGLTGSLPTSITAQAVHIVSGLADMVRVQMHFGSLSAHVNVSWLHPQKEHRLSVVGDTGSLVFDDSQPWESKLVLYRHRVERANGHATTVKGEAEPIALTQAEPLRAECEHFLQAIAAQSPVLTGADEAIWVLQVLTAAEEALRLKKEISMQTPLYFAHETAVIDDNAIIGEGSKVWHFSHILPGSHIGSNVTIGQNVMIGPQVSIGNDCKIQNNVSLYKGVTLEDGVFCGPSCVFTNVRTPRAEIERKDAFEPTHVGRGATIGANATIVCGNRIGAYAMVGAGAVVTHDVRPHALVAGNPARQIGWVSHAGERLPDTLVCPRENRRYHISAQGELEEITTDKIHAKR
jgi:UDP-2-acetamido-3-amino-2,3-dideoxy-glucuronate N-acetyltransferase